MYYELYQSIKRLVADSMGLSVNPDSGEVSAIDPDGLQDIQWFSAH